MRQSGGREWREHAVGHVGNGRYVKMTGWKNRKTSKNLQKWLNIGRRCDNILVPSVLPACASQQEKLSQLNLKPQPLRGHRNPHQRLPSSRHIKGQTSVSWLGKGKGFSLCVCVYVCLLHSKLWKKDFLSNSFHTEPNRLPCANGFRILLATICEISAFTHLRNVWGCMCLTYALFLL